MSKMYILDTNVLLHDPRSLFAFEDNEVVIPLVVLDELDKKKVGVHDETAKHARMVIRSLDKMRGQGNIHEGVKTDSGGIIKVELNHIDNCPTGLDPNRLDNRLIGVTLGLQQDHPDRKIILITKDINLRVKCDALSISVQDYNADAIATNPSSIYEGTTSAYTDSRILDVLYRDSSVEADGYIENQYVFLRSSTRQQHSALARFSENRLKPIKQFHNIWGISARNMEQQFALDALFDPEIKLVSLIGRAGTGKTLLAAAAGISQVLEHGVYRKLILTRPVQPMGKDIGYLPGTKEDKMQPWIAPLQDNLDLLFSDKGSSYLEAQVDSGVIEIEALTYIRGRSIPKSFIILDEAQNLTQHQLKTIITRISDGTKIVLTGDIMQIDNPYIDSVDNGLSCVVEKFKTHSISAHVTLHKGERSELATLASEIL